MKIQFSSYTSSLSDDNVNVFLVDSTISLQSYSDIDSNLLSKISTNAKTIKHFSGNIKQSFFSIIDGKKVLLIGINNNIKDAARSSEFCFYSQIGATITDCINALKEEKAALYIPNFIKEDDIASIVLGMQLRNYSFSKYFISKLQEHTNSFTKCEVHSNFHAAIQKRFDTHYSYLIDGVFLARDLVNEPANTLSPEEFVSVIQKKCSSIDKLTIKVLKRNEMQALKMNALLGVAQGSSREPQLLVMEWKGGGNEHVGLVGKGVTFDSGGISIKPSQNMGDMKGDMGGAATVAGTMYAIAKRNANINVVAVIPLVENMPSGTAQRPGDVVSSMSEQTIEIDNTDAEGRLILADALWYLQEKYHNVTKIIDLATLTGAITIALGDVYAGLFCNSDTLAKNLITAGYDSGELLWQLPIASEYDAQINSTIADIKNVGSGRGAGSTTAAQFLYRFIKNKSYSWAHIDIAGVSMSKHPSHFATSGGTGFGVLLLDKFMQKYEL
ncbi:Cytosol aminopeptidase [Candidatus Fokinia solitaria]|uniref:Probable cytosol aminopeptidase n=1 Tax=Candidatus Fokinia solitaria TaxID=1802984 RepID=A0A2U8BRX3_9RICK|nr:leucyl aminopeptidase [Candidatus Fokinia solitaria]AWD33104.1 Cytosol aminopeptidase [Candidatus Fokinia solitaria]